jgi:RNA polymerase sigma-70 factor (ECF subfamily)
MKSKSERDLLSGAQTFDHSCLTEIYDSYSPGIYRYAMRLLGDECMAEDCVADTFSRFLKALQNGQGPHDHLQAYLYRIAHNWITDSYRRQAPQYFDLDENHRDGSPHPESQVDARLEQERVRLALRALTPDQRQVIALKYLEGLENEDVAFALKKPVGSVKALQHRAIKALRKLLCLKEEESAYDFEK